MEETISIHIDGNILPVFIAQPKLSPNPGVLVLHAWWGLNDFVKGFCHRLENEEFAAIAPDLYHGKLAADIPQAEELSRQLDEESASRDLEAALEYLFTRPGVRPPPVALVGFSMGAFYALKLAERHPKEIGRVVLFYGTGSVNAARVQASVLGHFAENDPYEAGEDVQAFQENLQSAGRTAQFYTYPGTGHWFMESDRSDAYNPEGAALAWQRTIEFLKGH